MTLLEAIADATIGTLEDSSIPLLSASDNELLRALNKLGANNAIAGYCLIREVLRRTSGGPAVPELFDYSPSAGSEKS